MHRGRQNVASNNSNTSNNTTSEASSFPLVDFISKWRLRDRRGQTAPESSAAYNTEPLLGGSLASGGGGGAGSALRNSSNGNGDHDVPYPLPDAFLLPQQPRIEDEDEEEEEDDEDDDDDAQSIKSYGSDDIRQLNHAFDIS